MIKHEDLGETIKKELITFEMNKKIIGDTKRFGTEIS